ncbi:winged helix-turn-helix transcriptional regulator [Xenorhabdus nematophila]|uniref:Sugar kinase with ribokinase-like domain n=1 Tax=Xenorhabdus nematophila (strain ATCC 19061 / DSM 3370 / CCUG 14189 / LMG 1036 / NCIMB 9965 / AN6) TaxID=406817 RepID=D3V914_XENNA|nr:PfkB family carbohydrate kinase [Xenorhabdus nematophila]CEE93974.1 putative sugar kinase with ribokinase-like domain [Xenorhabdus nematophila str. Anatoliense]CEF30777.1 putative sugar kinase with ribokinase-like domain [Xenorhabdus nematophila str. Websteri]AYA40829.1 winged helix-turn-helix transcriptional regulator [Xenorhabdus nematophila]MBA0019580.1 winged helix-turn-helix transcriptional regulator [Xenorhabdus nematophila]MCB4423936.1 winged helix-turn-helix transcriptional regulato
MLKRENQILQLLKGDPFMQQQEIADILGISRSCVAGHIMNLSKKGYIKGKGYILSNDVYTVTIGAANIDLTSYTSANLIYEDSNPGKIILTPGGVGRNIAQNIALLKNKSHLISVIGDDTYGNTLFEKTKLTGVNVNYLYKIEGETTSICNYIINENGQCIVAVNDMCILEKLTPNLLSQSKSLIQHASVLVVDCNLTEEALKWLFQHARNIPIFVDTVSSSKAPRIRHWLSHIHTLKPNRTEAETLSGVKIKTQKDAADAALWFHRHGVQRLILSMDAEGVYYSELDSISGYSPAIHTNVINANGAGDVMMAGLVHCWLEGRELQESVLFAQQCSALTLSSEDIDLSPQNHSYL